MVGLSGQGKLVMSHSDTVCVNGSVDEQVVIAHTYVVNNTKRKINLSWQLANMAQPNAWETSVCDDNGCYPPFVTTNVVLGGNPDVPVELFPGDSSIVDMQIYSSGNRGIGYTKICFSEKENPKDELGCMTYKFKIGNASASPMEETPANLMEIFPNPTVDYFGTTYTKGLEEIHIYNMLGRKQRSFTVEQGKKYFVGDMPAGMYLLAFIDEKGKVIKTTRLVKRFFRP